MLDNLTLNNMINLFLHGGFNTVPFSAIGKPATSYLDGPSVKKKQWLILPLLLIMQ